MRLVPKKVDDAARCQGHHSPEDRLVPGARLSESKRGGCLDEPNRVETTIKLELRTKRVPTLKRPRS